MFMELKFSGLQVWNSEGQHLNAWKEISDTLDSDIESHSFIGIMNLCYSFVIYMHILYNTVYTVSFVIHYTVQNYI